MQKLENNKRVFGIVVLFGFETKNFFGSGLYEQLSKEHKMITLRREFPTENFDEYIDTYNLNVTVLEKSMLLKQRLKSERLFLSSRRARNRLKNIENFNYFKSDRSIKFSDYILGNYVVQKLLNIIAMSEIAKNYFNEKLEKIFDDHKMTDLLITGYSSPESIALANTAHRSGRNVWLVINSWKDFYVNEQISFTPTKTFVWSQQMKEQLLRSNSHISASDVMVSGNPSFDRFFEYEPVNTKVYYSEKYHFDPVRPLILYSMISPRAYEHEKEVIELINQRLTTIYPDEKQRPVMLLRRNPIDETVADEKFFSGNNIRYADNYFEGSYANAVFVQLNEGEIEWMDLLYHADINLNVASTVTLEALMMRTPVINIAFDAKGNKDEALIRYSEAPFYVPLHNRKDVIIASTIDVCMEAIDVFLKENVVIEDFVDILDRFDGKATERIFEEINNG